MLFKKKPEPKEKPQLIVVAEGMRLGQIVQHKMDHERVCIVYFYEDEEGIHAQAAFSSKPGDEGQFSVHELEALESSPSVVAVDPHVEDSGPSPTRD